LSVKGRTCWRDRLSAPIFVLLQHRNTEIRPHATKFDHCNEFSPISQETLAEMIGMTRSRVSFFMNKFRKLGFIAYNGGIEVHSSAAKANGATDEEIREAVAMAAIVRHWSTGA
jgi:hypothetical protein